MWLCGKKIQAKRHRRCEARSNRVVTSGLLLFNLGNSLGEALMVTLLLAIMLPVASILRLLILLNVIARHEAS
jgi:hypothetical protein